MEDHWSSVNSKKNVMPPSHEQMTEQDRAGIYIPNDDNTDTDKEQPDTEGRNLKIKEKPPIYGGGTGIFVVNDEGGLDYEQPKYSIGHNLTDALIAHLPASKLSYALTIGGTDLLFILSGNPPSDPHRIAQQKFLVETDLRYHLPENKDYLHLLNAVTTKKGNRLVWDYIEGLKAIKSNLDNYGHFGIELASGLLDPVGLAIGIAGVSVGVPATGLSLFSLYLRNAFIGAETSLANDLLNEHLSKKTSDGQKYMNAFVSAVMAITETKAFFMLDGAWQALKRTSSRYAGNNKIFEETIRSYGKKSPPKASEGLEPQPEPQPETQPPPHLQTQRQEQLPPQAQTARSVNPPLADMSMAERKEYTELFYENIVPELRRLGEIEFDNFYANLYAQATRGDYVLTTRKENGELVIVGRVDPLSSSDEVTFSASENGDTLTVEAGGVKREWTNIAGKITEKSVARKEAGELSEKGQDKRTIEEQVKDYQQEREDYYKNANKTKTDNENITVTQEYRASGGKNDSPTKMVEPEKIKEEVEEKTQSKGQGSNGQPPPHDEPFNPYLPVAERPDNRINLGGRSDKVRNAITTVTTGLDTLSSLGSSFSMGAHSKYWLVRELHNLLLNMPIVTELEAVTGIPRRESAENQIMDDRDEFKAMADRAIGEYNKIAFEIATKNPSAEHKTIDSELEKTYFEAVHFLRKSGQAVTGAKSDAGVQGTRNVQLKDFLFGDFSTAVHKLLLDIPEIEIGIPDEFYSLTKYTAMEFRGLLDKYDSLISELDESFEGLPNYARFRILEERLFNPSVFSSLVKVMANQFHIVAKERVVQLTEVLAKGKNKKGRKLKASEIEELEIELNTEIKRSKPPLFDKNKHRIDQAYKDARTLTTKIKNGHSPDSISNVLNDRLSGEKLGASALEHRKVVGDPRAYIDFTYNDSFGNMAGYIASVSAYVRVKQALRSIGFDFLSDVVDALKAEHSQKLETMLAKKRESKGKVDKHTKEDRKLNDAVDALKEEYSQKLEKIRAENSKSKGKGDEHTKEDSELNDAVDALKEEYSQKLEKIRVKNSKSEFDGDEYIKAGRELSDAVKSIEDLFRLIMNRYANHKGTWNALARNVTDVIASSSLGNIAFYFPSDIGKVLSTMNIQEIAVFFGSGLRRRLNNITKKDAQRDDPDGIFIGTAVQTLENLQLRFMQLDMGLADKPSYGDSTSDTVDRVLTNITSLSSDLSGSTFANNVVSNFTTRAGIAYALNASIKQGTGKLTQNDLNDALRIGLGTKELQLIYNLWIKSGAKRHAPLFFGEGLPLLDTSNWSQDSIEMLVRALRRYNTDNFFSKGLATTSKFIGSSDVTKLFFLFRGYMSHQTHKVVVPLLTKVATGDWRRVGGVLFAMTVSAMITFELRKYVTEHSFYRTLTRPPRKEPLEEYATTDYIMAVAEEAGYLGSFAFLFHFLVESGRAIQEGRKPNSKELERFFTGVTLGKVVRLATNVPQIMSDDIEKRADAYRALFAISPLLGTVITRGFEDFMVYFLANFFDPTEGNGDEK